MTVEVSGTGKLFGMEALKDGTLAVALRMPRDAIKFYDLKPGMFCKFTLIFPEKQDILEADEVEAIITRQKQFQKIDKFAEKRLRKWYEDMKAVYERGKKDPNFKVPDYVKRLFEQPDELEKALARISK